MINQLGDRRIKRSSDFWDALAPHHLMIENSYLDLPALSQILNLIQPPVLVVGAGQGMIVAELHKQGMRCDGVDISPQMIRYARVRRGLDLVQADATALPFAKGAYNTLIYATGVVDFINDEEEIRDIINEGKRIADHSGILLVAFSRISAGTERFLSRIGLMENRIVRQREALQFCRLDLPRAMTWVSKRAKVGYVRAAILLLGLLLSSTWQEKRNAFNLRRIFSDRSDSNLLIQAAPEKLAYRDEVEIRNLFARLEIPIERLAQCKSCFIVQI